MRLGSGMAFFSSAGLVRLAVASSGFADHVVSYEPGAAAGGGFNDPLVALGAPERFTGEGSFPSVVSPFSPPFGSDEIVSLGVGGSLVVSFDDPITDAAGHLFGADFIVFGNGGFIDTDYPHGRIGSGAPMFGTEAMRVSVSADGVHFVTLGNQVEGVFPTLGFVDSGPYDTSPGAAPTDFHRPVNPALVPGDFSDLDYPALLALYAGSGGGTPIDISGSGLGAVRFVRIELPGDAPAGASLSVDGFSIVPEPGTAGLMLGLGVAFRRKLR